MAKPPKFKIEEEFTGIYTRQIKTPQTKAATKAAWKELSEINIENFITSLRECAIEVYERYGLSIERGDRSKELDALPSEIKEKIPDELYKVLKLDEPFKIPNDAPPKLRDARKILISIKSFEDAIKKNDLKRIIFHAIRLGQLSEQFQIRDFEHSAMVGSKVRKGGRKGHEKQYGTSQEKINRTKEYQRVYNEHLSNSCSKTEATKRTAKDFQVSEKTIQRHLKA
jgi:hypothetical protein